MSVLKEIDNKFTTMDQAKLPGACAVLERIAELSEKRKIKLQSNIIEQKYKDQLKILGKKVDRKLSNKMD